MLAFVFDNFENITLGEAPKALAFSSPEEAMVRVTLAPLVLKELENYRETKGCKRCSDCP